METASEIRRRADRSELFTMAATSTILRTFPAGDDFYGPVTVFTATTVTGPASESRGVVVAVITGWGVVIILGEWPDTDLRTVRKATRKAIRESILIRAFGL